MTGPTTDHHQQVVLAIDLGTGGPKTSYVSLAGEVLDHDHRRVTIRTGPDGSAVEDATEWWDAVVASAQLLSERGTARADQIVAVACTGQWGSTVPVGADGQPVGDCILWLDQRARKLAARQLGGTLAVEGYRPRVVVEFIRRTGGAPSPLGNDPMGQRLWIRHEQPDVYARTAHFMEPVDFLNLRLTGEVAASQASMLASFLTDNRVLDAVSYDPLLARYAGTDIDRLPPLRPIRSVVGGVLPDVADELGIPAGTPVVTGLPDLHAATLGSGAVTDFHGHLSISTSAWVGCHTHTKRTSLMNQMATFPAALEGQYVLVNNHDCGGASMEWLLDMVVAPDDGLTPGATPTLKDLDDLASKVAPGADGVMFAPWLKGMRSPNADTAVRAAFLNIGIDAGRPQMVRAVLEGVAHQIRWLLEVSEQVLKHPIVDLRGIGGGAQSDVWCQIHADVIGRPVHRVAQPLVANVRGAALFAGLVTGRLDVRDVAACATVDRVFRPDPDAAALYQDRHQEFVGLHKELKGVAHRLHRITARS
ncbi:xylulokinase [Dermatobacter hominis]|uniref:xylulokinase n=1 Tax=Dermatobacter hominis TaxID=2884263 RepID=UPI001D12CB96|nr:FGGY-family carbohydrate kinase [Dermatobacter hominis]UDY34693.1 FGGY-family carbohydrate kinase [Dermatobacter hominis]